MQSVPAEHTAWQQFFDRYALVYADSETLRSEVYKLRSQINASRWSSPRQHPTSTIDVHDACAHHFLLCERASGVYRATTRLIPKAALSQHDSLPIEARMLSTSWWQDVQRNAQAMTIAELGPILMESDLGTNEPETHKRIELAMHLAAFALGQLLFVDYLLVDDAQETFKFIRAKGLQLEYASEVRGSRERSAAFYLNLNTSLRATSPLLAPLAIISKDLAPKLNLPLVQES